MEAAGVSVGAEGTIFVDLGGAARFPPTSCASPCARGLKGPIFTDGASFKRGKAVAIMFASNGLPEPVLLKLVHHNDFGVYDHVQKRWLWMFAPPSSSAAPTSSRFLLRFWFVVFWWF